ncbi:MAG TPA: tetratricopeptide repeat protein, partial [Methylomirabilota bacterium]|nr:tetratricopeptide repeat protein [Methylomirabilota bacterium]
VVLVALRRRWPGGLGAWGYSAIMVLPVSGAVHAGYQLAHDRYSYLSGLGFAVLAGAALGWVLEAPERGRLRRPVATLLVATAAVVVLALGAGAWRQSRLWTDPEALWRWALDLDPACAICNNNLGSAIQGSPPYTAERAALAEGYFRHAIRLRPERPNAHHNLGAALAAQKRYAEAEGAFREFMRLRPDAPAGPASLGVLLIELGRYEEAVGVLRRALAMVPQSREYRAALAQALRKRAEEFRSQGRAGDAAALEAEAVGLAAAAQRSTTTAR